MKVSHFEEENMRKKMRENKNRIKIREADCICKKKRKKFSLNFDVFKTQRESDVCNLFMRIPQYIYFKTFHIKDFFLL